eukprot:c19282_g1_i1 orf=630-1598(-)
MLRFLRATVARKGRTCSASSCSSSFTIKLKGCALSHPAAGESTRSLHHLDTNPFRGAPLVFLRYFSSSESSRPGENGQFQNSPAFVVRETETNEISEIQQTDAHETLKSQHLSDDCESLKSAEEDEILAGSEFEDESEADLAVESDPTAESGEDCAIDMSNVPEDLKEMLEDGYEIESAEEDLSSEGTTELLTIDEVKQVLEEVRARDVQIFSVQDRCEWTDLMVVATGISDRHVRGIADALVFKIKKKGNIESPLYPTIEGQVGGKWLVVDCGNIVIHVLDEDSRAYYKLEDLWTGDVRPSTANEDLEKMLRQAGLKDIEP